MESPSKPLDAASPRFQVKPWALFAYSLGGATNNILGNAISLFAFYALNLSLGISPTIVGILLAAPRLYDAILDPLMGNVSDRFRSRWGRRRPFIFWGGIAAAFSYVALWQIPRSWAPDMYIWAFVVLSLVYYTAATVFSVPWLAFGYELTSNVKERTRIMAAVQIAASITGLGMVWLLPVTQWEVFEDTLEGVRWVSLPVAIFMMLSGFAIFVFCKEGKMHGVSRQTLSAPSLPLSESLKATFKNKPFLILCGVALMMLIGIMSVNSLTPYLIIYYLHGGDMPSASKLIALNGTVWTVTGLAMVPLVAWAAGRIGKKETLIFCISMAFLGNLFKWMLYTPETPWMVIIPQFFVSLAFASLWTLVNSMVADSCDYTELMTGKRIEGMLAGVYGWLLKLGVALASLFSGVLIDLSGFDESAGVEQGGSVIFLMRLMEIGLPAVAYACSLGFLWFYPLTEERMKIVQDKLGQ